MGEPGREGTRTALGGVLALLVALVAALVLSGPARTDAGPLLALSLVPPKTEAARAGRTVTWIAVVRNDGSAAARGVQLRVAPPAGAVLSSARPARGRCHRGREVLCELGPIGARSRLRVELRVRLRREREATLSARLVAR